MQVELFVSKKSRENLSRAFERDRLFQAHVASKRRARRKHSARLQRGSRTRSLTNVS